MRADPVNGAGVEQDDRGPLRGRRPASAPVQHPEEGVVGPEEDGLFLRAPGARARVARVRLGASVAGPSIAGAGLEERLAGASPRESHRVMASMVSRGSGRDGASWRGIGSPGRLVAEVRPETAEVIEQARLGRDAAGVDGEDPSRRAPGDGERVEAAQLLDGRVAQEEAERLFSAASLRAAREGLRLEQRVHLVDLRDVVDEGHPRLVRAPEDEAVDAFQLGGGGERERASEAYACEGDCSAPLRAVSSATAVRTSRSQVFTRSGCRSSPAESPVP